jgi:uncharacterized repeat protein (TIGR03806 family)
MKVYFFLCLFFFSISLCAREDLSFMAHYPKILSEWNIFEKNGRVWSLKREVIPYALVNSLFTDYAEKFRTMSVPEGKKISYQEDGTLLFPDGTVLTKTFGYKKENVFFRNDSERNNSPENKGIFEGLHLIETRVLVKREGKWEAIPYIWDSLQEEARLSLIGKSFNLSFRHEDFFEEGFTYYVPNRNQCISCHMEIEGSEKIFRPIGVKVAKNLNRDSPFERTSVNQLENLHSLGRLEGLPSWEEREKIPSWDSSFFSLEERARAYLDINCAHCHSEKGSANTSGLYLNFENKNPMSFGICKKPVASGNGSQGAPYDVTPGHPEKSILYLRMNSKDPSVMMPELGRSLVHKEGVELVNEWILSLIFFCEDL